MIDPSVGASGAPREAAQTVYLHIGTHKSGTSFLQTVLKRNAARLEADGLRYPLDNGDWVMQVQAAREVLDLRGLEGTGRWDAMVREIQAWQGRGAVVSMEFYSTASPARAQRVVTGLAPWDVQVIITARDLVRVLPSAWQSMAKQGHNWSFSEFITAVSGPADKTVEAYRRFWRHTDLVAVCNKWLPAVGIENIHLITVPPSSAPPSTLWERFASVIGVTAPEEYDITQDRRSNFSLSYSDAEFVRKINTALDGQLSDPAYKRWVTRYFANRILRGKDGQKTAHDRPRLTPAEHSWAIERSAEMNAGLEELGVHVVGSLDELMPRPLDPAGVPANETPTAYPERAADIIAAVIRRIAEVDPQLPDDAAGPGRGDLAEGDDPDYYDDLDGDLEVDDEEPEPVAGRAAGGGRGTTPTAGSRGRGAAG